MRDKSVGSLSVNFLGREENSLLRCKQAAEWTLYAVLGTWQGAVFIIPLGWILSEGEKSGKIKRKLQAPYKYLRDLLEGISEFARS